MRALVTNDDGIDSPGLSSLARVAVHVGLEVCVAAPYEERSGSSAALSALEADGRLMLHERELPRLVGVPALAVHASPAMIVFAAMRGAFGDAPDLVLSGVNYGANTGQAVLHSGTVGAALTAASHGILGLAVSQEVDESLGDMNRARWDTAARAAAWALDWLLPAVGDADGGEPFALTVNAPNVAADKLRGLRAATLAHYGAVQAQVSDRGEGYVVLTMRAVEAAPDPRSDVALLAQGWASVTALRRPSPCNDVDLSGLERRA